MQAFLLEQLFPTGWRRSGDLFWRLSDAEHDVPGLFPLFPGLFPGLFPLFPLFPGAEQARAQARAQARTQIS